MRARCTTCNYALRYYRRGGFKLSAERCTCGGKYEPMQINAMGNGQTVAIYQGKGGQFTLNKKDEIFEPVKPKV